MVCQQHAERREQPHRHAHTERAALPFLVQAQPDAARIEQRPAEKEADQRKRRVKHQHAVRLTRDQQLHAERRGRRAQHQPPRMSLHRDTKEIRQQDELYKDEYVVQMDIRAAGQQVEKRMLVRRAAQRLENKIRRRPEKIRRQHARQAAAHCRPALRLEFPLRERACVTEAGQHEEHRHCKARKLIPDQLRVGRLPCRNVYHHDRERRRRPQSVHLSKPHCFPPVKCLGQHRTMKAAAVLP